MNIFEEEQIEWDIYSLSLKVQFAFYSSQPEILKWLIWMEVMRVDLTHCHCGTDIIY